MALLRPQKPVAEALGRAAMATGVDVSLLRAVAWAESGFNPLSMGAHGERGLMQLMPDTAKQYGCTDPNDPNQNAMAGARFLARLLAKYNGDERRALWAYNAGPARIERSDIPESSQKYAAKVLERRELERGGGVASGAGPFLVSAGSPPPLPSSSGSAAARVVALCPVCGSELEIRKREAQS